MKSRLLLITSLGVVALALAAPAQKRSQISSGDSFRIEFAERGKKFELSTGQTKATVSDVTGFSRNQGVDFSGNRATVVLRTVETGLGNAQIVDSADLSGNAKVSSSSQGSRTVLSSANIHLQESPTELTATTLGTATITHTGADAQTKSRTLVARGDKLTARLEPFASKSTQRLRSVDLSGQVKIDLDTVQVAEKQETAYKATVTGSRATMTVATKEGKSEWTIHLTGNVHLVGDQTSGGVTTNADISLGAATIVLNDKMELVSFEGGDE